MSKSKFISLDKKINELKKLTSKLKIEDVANPLFMDLIRFSHMSERIKLDSPARQIQYVLAIMASQDKIENTENLSDGKLFQIYNLLNEIFGKYLNIYLPSREDIKAGLDERWFKVRAVAMPTFLGYFFESEKISSEELRYDIINFYENFSGEIKKELGISNVEMLEITDAIGEILQANFDRVKNLILDIDKERLKFKDANIENYDELIREVRASCGPLVVEYEKLSREICHFSFSELEGKFDLITLDKFKELFVTIKGKSPDIHYITDDNPIFKKPIITSDMDSYCLCSFNFLLTAIKNNIDDCFKKGAVAEKFRKHRDAQLERDVSKIFRDFLPENALIIESAFENKSSSNEHDLVIIHDRKVLIIESKASPRREPLRDPSKAYQRISDDFNRKSGIQSGYDQARRLELLLQNNSVTNLYDKKGGLITTIGKEDFDEIFCICVTKDDFGMLATDLTILLEKDDDAKYPWVIGMHNLRFLIACLDYIGKDWEFFINYLRDRIGVFGKIMSNDELEFAGAYLKYDGFDFSPDSPEHKVFLDINESRVLDDISYAKSNGEEYILEVIEPPYYELSKDKLSKRKVPTTKMKKMKRIKRTMANKSKRKNR
ncbi:TPA: NERD domain-containing protein [Serratia marcescens]|nr:NERD domain-containing protein [Serratia marcescens]HEJ1076262.1 NERD domain-containing protein [Serratia marcescens]